MNRTAVADRFISSILNIVDLNIEDTCKMFFERPLEGILNSYRLHVVADCMIASYNAGGEPENFISSFKCGTPPDSSKTTASAAASRCRPIWGKTDGSDWPQGQMPIAMLLASSGEPRSGRPLRKLKKLILERTR